MARQQNPRGSRRSRVTIRWWSFVLDNKTIDCFQVITQKTTNWLGALPPYVNIRDLVQRKYLAKDDLDPPLTQLTRIQRRYVIRWYKNSSSFCESQDDHKRRQIGEITSRSNLFHDHSWSSPPQLVLTFSGLLRRHSLLLRLLLDNWGIIRILCCRLEETAHRRPH